MTHTSLKSIILIIFASMIGGVGQLLLKKASFSFGFNLSFLFNLFLIMGVLLYIVAIIFMILSFREGELSVLHPILSTSYLWVSFISPLIFVTETFTLNKIFGAVIIFLGVVFIGLGGNFHGRN